MLTILIIIYCLLLLFVLYRMIKNIRVQVLENIYLLFLNGFLGFVMGMFVDSMIFDIIVILIPFVVLVTHIIIFTMRRKGNKP